MKAQIITAILMATSAASVRQQPQFKTSTSIVRLEVSVTDEDGAVRGLQQDDFIVYDNGVRQVVRVQESADAPLDLVLVAEPMQSVLYTSGVVRDHRFFVDSIRANRVGAGLGAFFAQVEERDRLGVIRAGSPPTRLRRLESGPPSFDPAAFAGGSYAAPFDAIAAALREFTETDRRRALIAFTNAADFRSVLSFRALAEMARRLGPQFVLIGNPVSVDEYATASAETTLGVPIGDAVRGSVSGYVVPAPLQLLARRTGGITVNLGSGDPRELIEQTFTWLRTQYIVTYEPPGGKGWHPVSVKVNRRGATVTVREGYVVD